MSNRALRLGIGQTARPFALEEVQAAVRALQAGEFRNARPTARSADRSVGQGGTDASTDADARTGAAADRRSARDAHSRHHDQATVWTPQPGERVLAVVGSSGSSGASTVAIAVALSADVPARVVECCSASASGLAAATTAELGPHSTGWRQGRREQVLIERVSEVLAGVDEVPTPTSFEPGAAEASRLTVLDIGWEVGQLTTTDSWVANSVTRADQLLLVTTATVPGIRRLEGALGLIANHTGNHTEVHTERIWVAVLGPRRKKWPRGLQHVGGPYTRRALSSGRVLEIPRDRGLSLHGLDSRPVPTAVLAAAAHAHVACNTHEHDLVHDADQLDLFGGADVTNQPTG